MRKKFLQGAATLSMAAAVCIMSGLVTASAADEVKSLPAEKVTVDYEKQQVVVDLSEATSGSDSTDTEGVVNQAGDDTTTDDGTQDPDVSPQTGGDHEILFNVASVKNKELKASAWEVYDIGADKKVTIDISSLNTQKENYVQIKGDVSKKPITLFIPATDKSLKLKFNAYTGLVEATAGKDASKNGNFEYRTDYSDWSDAAALGNISLKMYQERGAKLYFRLSKEENSKAASAGTLVTGVKDKASGEELDVREMPSLPGKEIKVSVGKKANAPKASVNYKSGAVTIPAGTLYRVNDQNGLGVEWKQASSKLSLTSGDEYDKLLAGGSLEVKKAGDSGKKKAESKIFQLDFPNKRDVLSENSETANVKDNPITDPDGGEKVTAAITEVKDKKTQAVTSFNLTVTNNTKYDYEVVVGDKPTADTKSTAVKAGKAVTVKKVSKDGAKVWVRRSGNQKKLEWATEYIQMGVVPAATADKPGTGGEEVVVTEADLQAFAAEYIANPVLLETSGVNQGDAVDIAAAGKDFTWASKDYEVTVSDVKKTLKGVTVTVKSVTNGQGLDALDGSDIGDGLKYGSAVAGIPYMNDQNAPSAVVTVKCGDISYDHTLTFSK